MALLNTLYTVLIKPLQTLFEFIFVLSYNLIDHPAIAIIFLSLTMNLLVLPLYRKADALQDHQRELEKLMAPDLAFLKKTFKGDERVMMIQTYYRQHHYKPIHMLKGSLSLALEVPFFVAAYQFLSNLSILNGASFGPIRNLGVPDGMLNMMGITINVLPILMTVINLVSSSLYAKGYPPKTKIQLFGIAIVFLVLLYQSPAGLVFYWTLNNLFSLGKNVFYRVIRNPKKVLKYMTAVCGTCLAWIMFAFGFASDVRQKLFFLVLFGLCLIPCLSDFSLFQKSITLLRQFSPKMSDKCPINRLYFTGCSFLTLFLGLYVPTSVISASPSEFISVNYGPGYLIFHTLALYIGVFLWISVFYSLADRQGKFVYAIVALVSSGISLIDYFFFGKYGTLSSSLVYDTMPVYGKTEQFLNIIIVLATAIILVFLLYRIPKIINTTLPILIVVVMSIALVSCIDIFKEVGTVERTEKYIESDEIEPIFSLSTAGNNVVIIMLDRAVGAYAPYIFAEKPELSDSFDGFTWYSNTLSYGKFTHFATPALFGGYEYTPYEINERGTKLLVEEQNEALSLMPVLFSNNDYQVTVCDPPYAGYSWIPDLSIFENYEGVTAYNTIGKYASSYEHFASYIETDQQSNFFYYSLFRASPTFIKPSFYRDGLYGTIQWEAKLTRSFLNAYGVMENLCELTEITDKAENNFLMLQNDITHEPVLFRVPEYCPDANCTFEEIRSYYYDNAIGNLEGQTMELEEEVQIKHYQTNMVSYIELAYWLDYLKEQNVYDNTRIIIVSDHGSGLNQFESMRIDNANFDAESINSLLLVKDFNSHGIVSENNELMTIADVPSIAAHNIIDNLVNPFTGTRIDSSKKAIFPFFVTTSANLDIYGPNRCVFDIADCDWLEFNGDSVFDEDSWIRISTP